MPRMEVLFNPVIAIDNSLLFFPHCGAQKCPPGYSYGPLVRHPFSLHYILYKLFFSYILAATNLHNLISSGIIPRPLGRYLLRNPATCRGDLFANTTALCKEIYDVTTINQNT